MKIELTHEWAVDIIVRTKFDNAQIECQAIDACEEMLNKYLTNGWLCADDMFSGAHTPDDITDGHFAYKFYGRNADNEWSPIDPSLIAFVPRILRIGLATILKKGNKAIDGVISQYQPV